jgi:alpha-tubulin suppressor-like RCC1 family protein
MSEEREKSERRVSTLEGQPLMEGWLNKKAVRSLFKNNWKRRWIIVRVDERSLSYARTETAPPTLTLYFDDKSKVENTNEHGKLFEFKVTAKEHTFFAHADTASQRDRWVNFIQKAIEGPKKKVAIPGPPSLPPPPPMSSAPSAAAAGAGAAAAPKASPSSPASGPPKITSLAGLVKTTEDRTAKVMAVGSNDIGQLGTGQQNPSGVAVAENITVFKLKSAAVFVSAGLRYAAAISATNSLFTWGGGAAGQLGGDASMLRSSRPFMVPGFRGKTVLALACGGSHVLAVVAPNGAGLPSAAGNKDALTMGPLPAGSAVHHGAVGGQLFAWGSSSVGALGLGSEELSSFVPKEVKIPGQAEGDLVTYIAAGLVTSAAVVGGKQLYVWGDAGYGRLGLSDFGNVKNSAPVYEPYPLDLVTDVGEQLLPSMVALGGSFTCYLGRSQLAPPGSPSVLLVSGMIGVDVAAIEDEPGTLERGSAPLLAGAVSVSIRKPTLKKGDDSKHSEIIPIPTPTETFGTKSVILTAAAGATHYVVVHRDNGSNRKSQGVAKALLAAAAAGDAAASGAAAFAVPPPPSKPRGAVYTCGYGVLGHAPPEGGRIKTYFYLSTEPMAVGGALAEEDIVEVGCGFYTSYARNTSGQIFAWGVNEMGGLCTGRFVDVFAPVSCTEPADAHFEQMAVGPDFLIALQYNGLLGDVKARALAKNAFSKWKRKAAARGSVAAGTAAALLATGAGGAGGRSSAGGYGEEAVIGDMLKDISEEEGIELGGLASGEGGGDLGSIIQHLLREAESAAAEAAADAKAAGRDPADEEEEAAARGDGTNEAAIVNALEGLQAEASMMAKLGGRAKRRGGEEI